MSRRPIPDILADDYGFAYYEAAIATVDGSTVANVMLRQIRDAAGMSNNASPLTPAEMWEMTLYTLARLLDRA